MVYSCIFWDLAKAFDTVDLAILLSSAEDAGFSGIALKLLRSYIRNRKQSVVVGGKASQSRLVEIGVPQRTALGPVLFSIYINDFLSIDSQGIISC